MGTTERRDAVTAVTVHPVAGVLMVGDVTDIAVDTAEASRGILQRRPWRHWAEVLQLPSMRKGRRGRERRKREDVSKLA